MAAVMMTLTLEGDAIRDALQELVVMRDRLIKRHGAAFRDLERAIENLDADTIDIRMEDLGEGRITYMSQTVADLLRSGRRLGVI